MEREALETDVFYERADRIRGLMCGTLGRRLVFVGTIINDVSTRHGVLEVK